MRRVHSLHRRKLTMSKLTYTMLDGVLICDQMRKFPANFRHLHTLASCKATLQNWIEKMRECEAKPERGNPTGFQDVVKKIGDVNISDPLALVLYTMADGTWEEIGAESHVNGRREQNLDVARALLDPALPREVQSVTRKLELISVAMQEEHFALLYGRGKQDQPRMLVTDRQVCLLKRMHGHRYLDLLADGTPVCRSNGTYDRVRMFFDGRRLMEDERFETCAPNIRQSYKPGKQGLYCINMRHSGVSLVNGSIVDTKELAGPIAAVNDNGDVHLESGAVVRKKGYFEDAPVTFDEQTGLAIHDLSTKWTRE